jgi:hypothetical protein
MTFGEVLLALAAGKRVRRKDLPWDICRNDPTPVNTDHLLADDWEVVEEPPAPAERGCATRCLTCASIIQRLRAELTLKGEAVSSLDGELVAVRRSLALAHDAFEKSEADVGRLTRELVTEREARQFSHAGNATLTEAGAKMALELGQLRRELEQAKRDIAGRDTLNEILRKELAEATAKAARFEQRLGLVTGRIRELAEDWVPVDGKR